MSFETIEPQELRSKSQERTIIEKLSNFDFPKF